MWKTRLARAGRPPPPRAARPPPSSATRRRRARPRGRVRAAGGRARAARAAARPRARATQRTRPTRARARSRRAATRRRRPPRTRRRPRQSAASRARPRRRRCARRSRGRTARSPRPRARSVGRAVRGPQVVGRRARRDDQRPAPLARAHARPTPSAANHEQRTKSNGGDAHPPDGLGHHLWGKLSTERKGAGSEHDPAPRQIPRARVHLTFLRIAVVYMTGAWRRRSAMGDPVQQADEQRPSLPPPVHHWQHTAPPLMVMVARPMARAAAVVVTGAPVAAGAPNQLVWPPRPPPLLASHPTSLIWQQLPPAVLSTNGVGAPPPPRARPPTAFSTTGRLHQQQYHPSVVGGGRQASPPSPPSMSDRARDVVEDMERMRQNKTAQNTQIIALFRAGVTVREIARRLDVHHSTIVRRLKRLRSTDDEVLADGDQDHASRRRGRARAATRTSKEDGRVTSAGVRSELSTTERSRRAVPPPLAPDSRPCARADSRTARRGRGQGDRAVRSVRRKSAGAARTGRVPVNKTQGAVSLVVIGCVDVYNRGAFLTDRERRGRHARLPSRARPRA